MLTQAKFWRLLRAKYSEGGGCTIMVKAHLTFELFKTFAKKKSNLLVTQNQGLL